MNFLKKYWRSTTLTLVLFALTFWLLPAQEKLYFKSDYDLIEKRAFAFCIWTLSIAALTILILALRGVESWNQVGNVFMGLVAVLIPFFFLLKPIILSGFLLLNRIDAGQTIEKQYIAGFFLETNGRTPSIYDFREQKSFFGGNVKNISKLSTLNTGDTLIIHFHKGLLGFPFAPEIK